MAYIPTEWETGDVITAEKLNKAEQGIAAASGVFMVSVSTEDGTTALSKTWEEINSAVEAGKIVAAYVNQGDPLTDYCLMILNEIVEGSQPDESLYICCFSTFDSQDIKQYLCVSADDYPALG